MADSARVIVEVVAGLIPGKDPDPQYTRRFPITSTQWHEAGEKDQADGGGLAQAELLAKVNGEAQGYAMLRMLQPDRFNGGRTDWI